MGHQRCSGVAGQAVGRGPNIYGSFVALYPAMFLWRSEAAHLEDPACWIGLVGSSCTFPYMGETLEVARQVERLYGEGYPSKMKKLARWMVSADRMERQTNSRPSRA
jgi:hypothetical protein